MWDFILGGTLELTPQTVVLQNEFYSVLLLESICYQDDPYFRTSITKQTILITRNINPSPSPMELQIQKKQKIKKLLYTKRCAFILTSIPI